MIRFSFVIGSALLLVGGFQGLWAQHAGGHSPSGSGSSGHHGAISGTHSQGAPASITPSTLNPRSPLPGQLIYPTPIGLQPQFSGFTGINLGVLSNKSRRGERFGYGYPGFYPYYLSTFDDSPYFYDQNSGAADAATQTANVTANLLGEQIARLSAEVESLRSEREGPAYGPPAPPPPYKAPPAAQNDDDRTALPITLVLRDGRKLQVADYAVMGQDIWDFSKQPAKRISIASLNLPASKAETEANGGEFPKL